MESESRAQGNSSGCPRPSRPTDIRARWHQAEPTSTGRPPTEFSSVPGGPASGHESLIWGGVCQVGSGESRRWRVVCVCCGSGCGWRPERRGRFRLICEGWLPQDGLFARRGRGLGSSAPAGGLVLIARIAGPGVARAGRHPHLERVVVGWSVGLAGDLPDEAGQLAGDGDRDGGALLGAARRRGAPSGDAVAAARARRRRSRPAAGRPGGGAGSATRGRAAVVPGRLDQQPAGVA